jgi:hypothetical protein
VDFEMTSESGNRSNRAIGIPFCHALSALIADSATVPRASPHKR